MPTQGDLINQNNGGAVASQSRREFLWTLGAVPLGVTSFDPNMLVEARGLAQHGLADDPRKAEYLAAYRRLKDQFTLERVAANKIEVTDNDLVGMAHMLSLNIPVQARFHYEMVFVQPDLSIALGREENSLELGFALGEPPELADFYLTKRKLHKGYQPIVEQEWISDAIQVRQTSFGFLPDDEEVVTGNEKQYVMIRMSVANTTATQLCSSLYLMVGHPGPMIKAGTMSTGGRKDGVSLWPFTASVSRWRVGPLGIELQDNALLVKGRTLLVFRCNAPTPARFEERLTFPVGDRLHPERLDNCVKFDLRLNPGEVRTIDVVATGVTAMYPADERLEMTRSSFEEALGKAEAHWDRAREGGMQFTVPELRLNEMYKALVLSGFGNISKNPKYDWREPYQSPFLWESDPWEQAFALIPLMALGYTSQVEPCLRFYVQRQMGVGAHAATAAQGYGPPAAKAFRGSYPGSFTVDWMNFTGSVLWMLAAYYQYTRDAKWLKSMRPSILAAWDWIQSERAASRIKNPDGTKVRHYGLLPPGRAGDIPEGMYLYTFTDSYTWLGMSQVARAFGQAGLPEADRLSQESDEYRQCILDVMHHEEFVDPATGVLFVPSAAYWRERKIKDLYWHAEGPVQLFATGLLKPDDKRFAPMIEYIRRTTGILLGFAEYFPDRWYAGQVERTYYQCYLARGEFEKALLTFYTCMVYCLSPDCYQTAERNNMFESNFRPYMPNASGTGRLLDMLRRAVIDEQEADSGRLWLLRGCPRPWFAKDREIVVDNAPTLFGKMALRTHSSGGAVTVDIDPPDQLPLREIRLVVRQADRKPLLKATVNGLTAESEADTIILPAPRGHLRVECSYE